MSIRSFVGICFASVRRLLRSRRCKQRDTLFIFNFFFFLVGLPPFNFAPSIEVLLSTPCGWVSLYLWLSLPKHTLSGDGTVNRFVITFTNLLLFRSLLFVSRI